ncbi:MAG: hypothetical protein QXI12_04115 [Candidatus Methanomethyliaceae archaeon]
MTDIIFKTEDGKLIHKYIDDKHPAIVYISVGGTIRVKRNEAQSLEERVVRTVRSIAK